MSVMQVDFSIIKNLAGFYYTMNDKNLQSLSSIQAGEGYLIYLNKAEILTVDGVPLEQYTTQLHAGWNLVGVANKNGKSVSELPAQVTEVKSLDNTAVETLEAGQAYYMYATEDATIEW